MSTKFFTNATLGLVVKPVLKGVSLVSFYLKFKAYEQNNSLKKENINTL